jgi:hypothetical protein
MPALLLRALNALFKGLAACAPLVVVRHPEDPGPDPAPPAGSGTGPHGDEARDPR